MTVPGCPSPVVRPRLSVPGCPRLSGLYDGLTPPKKRVSSLEGGDFCLDCREPGPWYWDIPGMVFAPGDGQYTNEDLTTEDTPKQSATDMLHLSGDQVDRFRILLEFRMYIAVQNSRESVNDSDKVYTQRALASWSFDGDGDVDEEGNYTSSGGNGGDSSFGEITNGDRVLKTDPPTSLDLILSRTWSTQDQ